MCIKFQVDSSIAFLSYAPKTEFGLYDVCDLENQGDNSKMKGFPRDLWGNYIPGFSLIPVVFFELLCGNACLTEFDLCELCDLENQGHNPNMNRLPQGPMGKVYIPGFKLKAEKHFELLCGNVSLDRETDGWRDG